MSRERSIKRSRGFAPARSEGVSSVDVLRITGASDNFIAMVNCWHDVDPGEKFPEEFLCVIEIPKGGHTKYELDKKTGLLFLDRVLHSAVYYPANYGLVPQTYGDDGDPLDVLVLGQDPVVPLCVLRARPIGVMDMIDSGQEDAKIIAVHANDPSVSEYTDIAELPRHVLNELERFFEDYKKLEHKSVSVERFLDRANAFRLLQRGKDLYDEKIRPR